MKKKEEQAGSSAGIKSKETKVLVNLQVRSE